MELDMTKGSPLKLIVKFIIPVIIGNIFQPNFKKLNPVDCRAIRWRGCVGCGRSNRINHVFDFRLYHGTHHRFYRAYITALWCR